MTSGVTFITHDLIGRMFDGMDPNQKHPCHYGDIFVGDNVFIGARSVLLQNVHIGNNVIIGAGSVVTTDIPDGSVAAGVPCKVIGSFEDFYQSYNRQQ